jgi:phosphoglycerate dehydrogenase-like enzyme
MQVDVKTNKETPRIGVIIQKPLRDQLITRVDQDRLNAMGHVTWTETTQPLTVAEAIEVLGDCHIGVGSWGAPFPSAELLAGCPKLALWEHVAGSVKYMFGPHLETRSLIMASCKPALADVVAEMTLGQIILGLRRAFENADQNRTDIVGHPARIKVLFGSTVGIVGASLIGKRVINLLRPFCCDILLFDPYLTAEDARALGTVKVDCLADLCAASDVVSLHTPDIAETKGIMGETEFAAMADDTIFINTARGACVDEDALIRHLSRRRLLAMLDVTEPEPPALDSPFRTLPNCVYTSHIAGPPCFNLGHQAVNDIEAYLSGGMPEYVVTPDMLEITA